MKDPSDEKIVEGLGKVKLPKYQKVDYIPKTKANFILEDNDILWERLVNGDWQITYTRWFGNGLLGHWHPIKGLVTTFPFGGNTTEFTELTYDELFYVLL